MLTARKPLAEVTAADVMTREVKTISQDLPLVKAARMFLEEQITGAPVVDPDGRCIGVLSANDFVRWTEHHGDTDSRSTVPSRSGHVRGAPPPLSACFCSDWQIVNLEDLPDDAVRWHMTPDPVMAAPSASIADLAQRMIDAHIHRIIVVDGQRRPIGIVASTDILSAVAQTAGESFD